jgi:short-subunit dehydrogenase
MTAFHPITLITGASSGIGADLARVFAAHGHELMLVARNEAQLNAIADEIGRSGAARPYVLAVDLCRLDASARIGQELAARKLEPEHVVNNAGFGLVGPADQLDRAEQLAMVDINVRALTDLSLRWIESIRTRRGGILNVASVAGFMPSPGMAVYFASKAYVVSFSEALHAELAGQGVRVTALCPGPVPTNFQERAGLAVSRSRFMQWLNLPSADVAQAGYAGFMAGKRLVVPGLANKLAILLPRIVTRERLLTLTDSRPRRRRDVGQWPRSRGQL